MEKYNKQIIIIKECNKQLQKKKQLHVLYVRILQEVAKVKGRNVHQKPPDLKSTIGRKISKVKGSYVHQKPYVSS